MAVTYEPIASQTLGSTVNSATFSNIPGTYTDLVLRMALKSSGAATITGPTLRVNSDSGSNYSFTVLSGNGSSASSNRVGGTNGDRLRFGEVIETDNFSPCVVHFFSYANTNVYKTLLCESAAPSLSVGRIVGLWRSTSAITSITVYSTDNGADDLVSGSTLSLYGIKAA